MHTLPVPLRRWLMAALPLAFFSCDSGGPVEPALPPFSVGLGSSAGQLTRGQTVIVAVTITRNDASVAITLTIEGTPNGLLASVDPEILGPTATSATLTILATAGAPVGSTTLTVRAASDGLPDATTAYEAEVFYAGFQLLTMPPMVTVLPTGNVAFTVLATPRDYTGDVSLAADPPPGISVTFSQDPSNPARYFANLTATGDVAAVTYSLRVTGTAPGSHPESVDMLVRVRSAGPTSPFSLDFCEGDEVIWLAYQNEGAEWTRVLPDAEDTFRFDATPAFGLAIAYGGFDAFETEVVYATIDELAARNGLPCREVLGSKQLYGVVTNVPDPPIVRAYRGPYESWAFFDTAFVLGAVPDGPVDITAFALRDAVPVHAIIRRNVNEPHGTTLPVFDFASPEAVPIVFNVATKSPILATETYANAQYYTTAGGTQSFIDGYGSLTGTYFGMGFRSVAGEALLSGDYHTLLLNAYASQTRYRGVATFYTAATDLNLPLGDTVSIPAIRKLPVAGSPRLRISLDRQASYGTHVRAILRQQNPSRRVVLTVTSAYLGTVPETWHLESPDLSTVDGYVEGWGLLSGGSVASIVEAFGSSNAAVLFGATPNNGDQYLFAHWESSAGVTASCIRPPTNGTFRFEPQWRSRRFAASRLLRTRPSSSGPAAAC